jgi:hypothetical protein
MTSENYIPENVEVVVMLGTIWGIIVLASIIWVIYDVLTQNKALSTGWKIVWIFLVLIFGIFGAIAYYFLGRE